MKEQGMLPQWMGFIERGRVVDVGADGVTVASLDRDGILSPPLGCLGEGGYVEGDMVLFVLFNDGTGKVLCGA